MAFGDLHQAPLSHQMFTGVEDGTTTKDPSPATQFQPLSLPRPQYKPGHSFLPPWLWEALLGWSYSSLLSRTFSQYSCHLSLLWDLVPPRASWAQGHVCLNHLSLTHLLRTVSSNSLCPLLAPPLSSPFPLPPFQESFQPLAASSVQFPQCLSAFRKSRRKQMYPWEVTDSNGDLSL